MNAAVPTRAVLIGGTSEIGLAIVRRLGQTGPVQAVLVGRDAGRMESEMDALSGAGVGRGGVLVLDAEDLESHPSTLDQALSQPTDVVIVAVGLLGAQSGLDADPDEAASVMRVNFLGTGNLVLHSLRRLRKQGRGTLVVLSSVAAERPRAGNAIYGAAKAGLDSLAQGLADAAAGSGVRVLVVRPGFVKTKMTAGLKPAPFSTTPDAVAEATVAGLSGRATTVWVPGILRWLFVILRHVPRRVFRRLPG